MKRPLLELWLNSYWLTFWITVSIVQ